MTERPEGDASMSVPAKRPRPIRLPPPASRAYIAGFFAVGGSIPFNRR